MCPLRRIILCWLLIISCRIHFAIAHDSPVQLPPPRSDAEAWNVIEQSKANIDQLLGANLMRDVAGQLANTSVALRYLNDHAGGERAGDIRKLGTSLLDGEAGLLRDSRDADNAQQKTKTAWADWCKQLSSLESLYPDSVIHAEVYICPMHPDDRHLDASDKCSVCGMSLVRRHLPASAVFQTPGEPTLKMTVNGPPLVVGTPATWVIRLSKPDGKPVLLSDLIEVHTKKIHLLINDPSLSDYHHEHPVPTQTPGEYQFTFTPRRPGSYRIWADVVPADSGIQEYDMADLKAADPTSRPIEDRQTRLTTIVEGRRYELKFETGADGNIRARQTVIGTISVTGADGTPFTQLEPIMGAFAHLVGFSEDGKSILHIHPSSKEPSGPEDRAGPVFAFKFYAPAAGFLRLYCQVRIAGADVFVPFNLNIAP
jgi:hypothetical protein